MVVHRMSLLTHNKNKHKQTQTHKKTTQQKQEQTRTNKKKQKHKTWADLLERCWGCCASFGLGTLQFGFGRPSCVGRAHRRPRRTDGEPPRGPRTWESRFRSTDLHMLCGGARRAASPHVCRGPHPLIAARPTSGPPSSHCGATQRPHCIETEVATHTHTHRL